MKKRGFPWPIHTMDYSLIFIKLVWGYDVSQKIRPLMIIFIIKISFSFFLFFFVATPMAHESSLARIWIQAAAVTYAISAATLPPLTHCSRTKVEIIPLQRKCWILNALCHSGNSQIYFCFLFIYLFIFKVMSILFIFFCIYVLLISADIFFQWEIPFW